MRTEQLDLVRKAHEAYHRDFTWQPDLVTFRREEYWSRLVRKPSGVLVGDCDDWVLEMDWKCETLGVSIEDRKFAACRIMPESPGQDHLVLLLRCNGSWWVSDCNHRTLVPRKSLTYDRWVAPKGNVITDPWETVAD